MFTTCMKAKDSHGSVTQANEPHEIIVTTILRRAKPSPYEKSFTFGILLRLVRFSIGSIYGFLDKTGCRKNI